MASIATTKRAHQTDAETMPDARITRWTTRSTVGLAATVGAPLLLWADTLCALLRGWQPPSARLLPAVFAVPLVLLAVATVGACAAGLFARGRAFYARHAPTLALTAASCVASSLAADLVANLRFDAWTSFHRRPANLHVIFRAQPNLFQGVQGEAHYHTNSLGIRGPELPAERAVRRILCVGGSAVECVYLDDHAAWTHLLMSAAGAGGGAPLWAGGVGISGFTTVEHLQFAERSSLLSLMDDAVFLVGFNDAGRVVIGAAESGPAPNWRNSALFLFTLEALRRVAEHKLIDHIDAFGENIRLKRLRRQAAAKTERLPDFRVPLREYSQRLQRLVRVCRARGVRPTLVTQPVLYDRALPAEVEARLWLGETVNGEYLTAGRLREVMEAYNAALVDVCRAERLACIDLSDVSGRADLFLDDCHFNEAGSTLVAQRLAAAFVRTPGR